MIQSLTARDVMTAQLVTFREDQSVMDAMQTLVSSRISGGPVLDQTGNLVGLLTEQDCIKVALESGYNQIDGGKVSEYMSTEVQTVDIDTPVIAVAELFLTRPFRRYPVVDGGRVVGIISRRNILQALH